MKPRILHTEASMGWGGQEIRIVTEMLGLQKRGYWVGLAASPKSQIYKQAKKKNIPLFPLNLEKRNLKAVRSLINILKSHNIAILNTHSSWDSWVGGLAKIIYPRFKLIRTRHLSTPIGRNPLSWLIYNVLPDKVITTGNAIKERMISHNHFNPQKIVSIPTGVDISHFKPDTKPALPKNGFLIGTISVLRSWKGHRYLIMAVPEILRAIPQAQFYLVGEGPQRKNLEKMISKMGLADKVILLGHREDIPEIMASLDVIVHPSTEHEGVPQTLLQTLASKKPVIATNVGSIPEIIKHFETGLLIPPENPKAIAQAVITLASHPEISEKIASNGRSLIIKQYSLEKMLDEIEKVYQLLLT